MKTSELRDKETDALKELLAERRKHLFTLRGQSVTEKLADPSQYGKARRDIARIHTILRQREQDAAAKKTPATQA